MSLLQIFPLRQRRPLPIEVIEGHLLLLNKVGRPAKSPVSFIGFTGAAAGNDLSVIRLAGAQQGMDELRPMANGTSRFSCLFFQFDWLTARRLSCGKFVPILAGCVCPDPS